MLDLRWSWLCIPFIGCAAALSVISLVAALVRGDRVLRLGVISAAMAALPWAVCSSIVACTEDPGFATRLLRLGAAPLAMTGPHLLLVLLGLSGQLERHRRIAQGGGVVGAVLLVLCLATDWTVPGVRRLTSGMYYLTAGPLTDLHISQLVIWLAVGLVIARRSMMRGERRRLMRVLALAAVLAAIGSTDMLLVHGLVGGFPIAWLPATIACGVMLYLELGTDLLRRRGFDVGMAFELAGFTVTAVLVGIVAFALHGGPIAIAVSGSALWVAIVRLSWGLGRRRPPPQVVAEHALDRFVARLADLDDDRPIAAELTTLWREASIAVRATWRSARTERGEPTALIEIATGEVWELDRDIAAWLVRHGEPLAAADLATMRLRGLRSQLEAMVAARGATLFVPLIDRDALVGLVEADHVLALREAERGLIAESARTAARALTYVSLARLAAREGVAAREVEVAEAMRRQVAASRTDELGPWVIAAEYRSAARTTGAAWSAHLLADGRLAVLVIEGQAHGVVAALATAALTGAFAASTMTTPPPGLDELLEALRASAEGVLRRGEPIAAFVAILDAAAGTVAWGCAGHPGAYVVANVEAAPVPLGGGGAALGDAFGVQMRGEAPLGPGEGLVIASSGVRGGSSSAWDGVLRAYPATGSRLAALLVETAGHDQAASDDLLAVVVSARRGGGQTPATSPPPSPTRTPSA